MKNFEFACDKIKEFKEDLRKLLETYDCEGDRILIHLGENNGIKGGEITKYF